MDKMFRIYRLKYDHVPRQYLQMAHFKLIWTEFMADATLFTERDCVFLTLLVKVAEPLIVREYVIESEDGKWNSHDD